MAKPKILFACPGDGARSIMARGFARYYAGNMVDTHAASADPQPPSEYIVWGMNEAGIDISQDRAKGLDALQAGDFDYVVRIAENGTVSVPLSNTRAKTEDWRIANPSKVRGQTSDVIKSIRLIRYQVEMRVHEFLARILERD